MLFLAKISKSNEFSKRELYNGVFKKLILLIYHEKI